MGVNVRVIQLLKSTCRRCGCVVNVLWDIWRSQKQTESDARRLCEKCDCEAENVKAL